MSKALSGGGGVHQFTVFSVEWVVGVIPFSIIGNIHDAHKM